MLVTKKQVLSLTLFFSVLFSVTAQEMEVYSGAVPPYDPMTLIEQVLLGEGVEILDIQYEGADKAVGYFNNGTSAMGLEEGIVLTTGVAVSGIAEYGITEPGSIEASANNSSTATDVDIDMLADGQDVFNLTKYTITFRPSADMMSFRYVFASEEYPEFGCTDYNDIFGFFISGPGISGPFENNGQNIALIPGTQQVVAINNVHPQNPSNPNCTPVFEEYFNDNDGSSDFPVYDGYLDIFTAETEVMPCEVYTIKLVIADITDAQRDSGVFFEAKSFNSKGVEVSAQSQAIDGSVVETCTQGEFIISVQEPASADIVIDYNMIGDALNGTDYELVQGDIIIPAGQTMVSVPITPLQDDIVEGVESVGIDVQINSCTRDTFYLYIRDSELETPNLGDDQAFCEGDTHELDGTVNIMEFLSQTFGSENENPVIIIPPIGSLPPQPAYIDLEVSGFYPPELREDVIQSVCVNIQHGNTADLDIYLYAPNGNFILLSSDNGGSGNNYTNTCFSPTATQLISAPAAAAPFTGEFLPEGNFESLWFGDSPINGTWRLMVIDDETASNGQVLDWSITFNPTYEIQYSWSPSEGLSCTDCPNPIASPTESKEYVLTVLDSHGCQTTDAVQVNIIDSYDAPAVSCSVNNDEITFSWNEVDYVDGYEINIDNAGWVTPSSTTSHTVSNLSPGETVSLQVRGTGECDAEIGTSSCQAMNCDDFTITTNITDPNCHDATGSISVTSTSNSAGHTYVLDGDTANANTTGTFSNIVVGNHQIIITDNDNCTDDIDFTITAPTEITSSTNVTNNIDCDNDEGVATVSASGGTGVLSYAWSNGDTGSTLTTMVVGTFDVTITDENGCTATNSVEIISEGGLAATTSATTICSGETGEASVNITQGQLPITYVWDSNANNQTTVTATNLTAGTYNVTVTSADNCQLVLMVTIDEYPEMTLTVTGTDASCGQNNGAATASVTGGTPGYTYAWDTNPVQTTADISNLSAGQYTVTVTDNNGCEKVESIVINTPSTITQTSINTTDVTCNGLADGSVMMVADGGTTPLSYALGSGMPQATGDFSNLLAGSYNIVVTDAVGCTASFPFMIGEPTAMTSDTLVINNIDCQNPTATATVTVSGGTGTTYEYLWSNNQTSSLFSTTQAGQYTVTITDEADCSIIDTLIIYEATMLTATTSSQDVCSGEMTGSVSININTGAEPYSIQWDSNAGNATTETVNNLSAGTYSVTVSDANNCQEILSATISDLPAISLATTTTEANCNGTPDGSATVTATGGNAPFTYAWNTTPIQTTATATNLAAGLYTVTITDANGCTATEDANVNTPSMLSVSSIVGIATSCSNTDDGQATVTATGGDGTFNYLWNDPMMQTTAMATNLAAGNYSVTITDGTGCTVSANININNPSPIQLSFATMDVACANDNNGSIDMTIANGVAPYTILWDNNQSTENLNNLSAGVYMVTVTDDNGCTASESVTINSTTPIDFTYNITNISCYGSEDGVIDTEINGGQAPYTYAWSNGETSEDLVEMTAGVYSLTVTDVNGCGFFNSMEITEPAPFYATVQTEAITCISDEDGSITITPVGGQPDYLFSIDGENFGNLATFSNLAAQDYTISVIDNSGCTYDTTGVIVPSPDNLLLEIGDDQTVNIGEKAEFLALYGGGTGDIEIIWGATENLELSCTECTANYAYPLYNSLLTATAIDANGCSTTDELNIYVRKDYQIYFPNVFSPNLDGENELFMPYSRPNTFIKKMAIYDRWGDEVYIAGDFHTVNEIGWDGRVNGQLAKPGVYVYWVEAIFPDGASVLFKGDVTLLR